MVEAGDGEEALRVIARDEAQMLDAVVTDLAMPVRIRPGADLGTPGVPPCIAGRGHVGIGSTATRPPAGAPPAQAVRFRRS